MNETIKRNLQRVSELVDQEIFVVDDGVPLFSWLELSPIDTCNRKCVFCPKSDDKIAPDQPHIMPDKLYRKLANELQQLSYKGTVMLAGYGEPMLSKNIYDMVKCFSAVCNTEITTNGDPLTPDRIKKLLDCGISKIVVSLYDDIEQLETMQNMFKEAGAPDSSYILRDRWYGADKEFGLKLTNRAGTLNMGDAAKEFSNHICHYPDYMMMIDWNGDVMLCTQDWNRRIKSGNLNYQSLLEVWNSSLLKRYRRQLHAGNRKMPPCKGCNADGTLHGKLHAQYWDKYYESKS